MSLGEYLKEKRSEKQLTIREVSNLTGVSHPYISQIETGKIEKPTPKTLRKLAKGLGVTYSEILLASGNQKLYEEEKFREAVIDFSEEGDLPEVLERLTVFEEVMDLKNLLESKELEDFDIQPRYNGHQLTEQDRQRILNILKEVFPEYQEKPEKGDA